MKGPFIPLASAAADLGLEASTLRRQAEAGVLRATKLGGRNWFVAPAELERYRAEHRGRPGRRPKAEPAP